MNAADSAEKIRVYLVMMWLNLMLGFVSNYLIKWPVSYESFFPASEGKQNMKQVSKMIHNSSNHAKYHTH